MSDMKHNTISRSTHADKQLLRTPSPQPDESLMGYILRLSETNYYETPKWILDLAGLKIYSLKMGWRKLCDGRIDFTLFRQLTRLSEEEVNEMRHIIARDIAQWDIPVSDRVSESEQAPMRTSATPFEQLGFGDLSRVMLCLAHFTSVCAPRADPLRLGNRSFHQALEEVAAILDDWPEKFHLII
jgi:hypothetical protein